MSLEQKQISAQQKYYESNKDKMKEHMRNYYNNKFTTDLEFKEKELDRIRIMNKNRYYNDPEYKEKQNAKRRALYHKNKANKDKIISFQIEV